MYNNTNLYRNTLQQVQQTKIQGKWKLQVRIVLLQVRYWSQVLTHLQLASGTSASSSSRGNGEGLPAISPTKRNIHFSSNTLYLVLVMFPTKLLKERNDAFNIVGLKNSLDLCTQNQKMVASVSIAFFLVGVQPL